MDTLYTRRNLLVHGGRAMLSAAAGAGALGMIAPPAASAIDWAGLLKKKMEAGGYGVVKSLLGEAFAGERRLSVGSRVESGIEVRVSPRGRLILNMSDRSVFQFTGPASLELILSMMREGIINLLTGALLAVVPGTSRYLVGGPTGTVGIKGTVFYREVYAKEAPMMRTMDGLMRAPMGAAEYFCNCHGEVEYHDKGPSDPFYQDRAEHHNAFFINPGLPNRLVKAPMANHSDDEILALVALQEGEKHDVTWIERFRRSQRR
jgi:hypothetical protein